MDDTVKQDLGGLIKKYDEFISMKLKPSLKKELDERDLIFNNISEYQKLNMQIETIQDNKLNELKTMVDLGSQFFVQAHVPDTKYIYINVGFGFHVQFTLDEAKKFIEKKVAHLQGTYQNGRIIPVDWILFLYFSSHIPITIFFDLQNLYPQWIIPTFFQQLNGTYIALLNDPFMDKTSPVQWWFKSFLLCEAFLQLPFFFFAAYGVFKDKSWVRLPLAVYCAHVMTTVLPCLAEIVLNTTYGLEKYQRNILLMLYSPYFFIPLIGLVDSCIRITNKLKANDAAMVEKKNE
ncbi:hypothetical protein BD408DRAFT_381472 [Parasitella parasitica]|nr:hypothetical protein BD408DRAFT_381472 [Parasitella parasitica]